MSDILLVDNDPDYRITLARLLTDAGHTVWPVASDREALAALEQKQFDFAIIDVRLYGVAEEDESGLILAAGCRGLRPDMHVIMLTGFLRAHQVVRAIRQYRVADFVEKAPDVHERLLSTIDQILDARHRAERLGQFNLGAIRRLIMEAFLPKDLRRLCEECPDFRPVLNSFGAEIGIRDMADILIEYCRTRLLFSELLSQIETRNPRQYAKYRSQLYTGHPQ